MQLLQFPDKCVSYQTFVHDVAAQVAFFMKADRNDLERISKNKAFSMFGRGNVERWRDKGRLTFCKRTGKVEYLTS